MPLTIELSPAAERALAQRAAQDGKPVEAVARELIERAVAPAEKTFDEILAPFREEFAASGMTDQEFDALIEHAREEVWRDRPVIVEPRRGGSQ